GSITPCAGHGSKARGQTLHRSRFRTRRFRQRRRQHDREGGVEANWTGEPAVCQFWAIRGCGPAGVAVVRLDNIGKSYGAGADVLHNISLTLEAGDFCCVTGASGAGKTTLLNIVALAEQPSYGRLTLFGADALAADRDTRAALRRRIGIVFQGLRLLAHLGILCHLPIPFATRG